VIGDSTRPRLIGLICESQKEELVVALTIPERANGPPDSGALPTVKWFGGDKLTTANIVTSAIDVRYL
jgi:hypothetical protein